MALSDSYVLATSRIPDVFGKIRDGQAPERLGQQLLKDWGFTSSNDKAFIGLLKSLGFLTQDGKPTQRYLDYRDHSRSKSIMAEAMREAYGDIFLIKANPTANDKEAIDGKFKSFHNASPNVAGLMTKTFLALLPLAEFNKSSSPPPGEAPKDEPSNGGVFQPPPYLAPPSSTQFHYNIQIHLPATKDVEVYNAIFKSLRSHLI
jgi:Family of unknown function (DUF5343)